MPKKHEKSERFVHSDQKNPKNIVRFGQNLVPFLLLSQLNHLKIKLRSKNEGVSVSRHLSLPTGVEIFEKS